MFTMILSVKFTVLSTLASSCASSLIGINFEISSLKRILDTKKMSPNNAKKSIKALPILFLSKNRFALKNHSPIFENLFAFKQRQENVANDCTSHSCRYGKHQ